MNRRRLFAMLPVASIATLLPAVAEAAPEPIDTRPTFKRSHYRLVATDLECRECGHLHGVYTRDCHMIAFPIEDHGFFGPPGEKLPATEFAVPLGITIHDCPVEMWLSPAHAHADLFRWVDE